MYHAKRNHPAETQSPHACRFSLPQAGDCAKIDPRCIVSRGAGLTVRPPDALGQGGLIKELKKRLLKVHGDNPQQDPLRTISNTMASNSTDCLLAPHFPGDIALVSLNSERAPPIALPVEERLRKDESARRAAISGSNRVRTPGGSSSGKRGDRPPNRGRSQRGSSAARREGRPSRSPSREDRETLNLMPPLSGEGSEARKIKLVMVTQALVAVGADVTVTPLALGLGSPKGGSVDRPSTIGHLSVCEGRGEVAVAAIGRLRQVRLKAGQRRLVDSSRVVGWTSGVTRQAGQGRPSGGSMPPATSFVGPGVVYVQTHSLAGLRRLLLPQAAGSLQQGRGVSGFRRLGQAGSRKGDYSRRTEVGISLKRGLAKRAREGARRAVLAVAFFGVYVVVYSLVTALLLEGRDGIHNAPRHALQVVRSLAKVVRRLAVVLIKLGREELCGGGRGGARGVASPPVETPAER